MPDPCDAWSNVLGGRPALANNRASRTSRQSAQIILIEPANFMDNATITMGG
jgi:hypothetical protein